MNTSLKRGYTFTHKYMSDISWEPQPGQKYADAPKAEMVVTHVTSQTVWYTYAGGTKGLWRIDRNIFEQRYVDNHEHV